MVEEELEESESEEEGVREIAKAEKTMTPEQGTSRHKQQPERPEKKPR